MQLPCKCKPWGCHLGFQPSSRYKESLAPQDTELHTHATQTNSSPDNADTDVPASAGAAAGLDDSLAGPPACCCGFLFVAAAAVLSPPAAGIEVALTTTAAGSSFSSSPSRAKKFWVDMAAPLLSSSHRLHTPTSQPLLHQHSSLAPPCRLCCILTTSMHHSTPPPQTNHSRTPKTLGKCSKIRQTDSNLHRWR